jgi:hypothetical protein
VLCTLLINAPALPFILRVTGLTKVSLLTLQSRDKARQQFLRFTHQCIHDLQCSADERMQVLISPAAAAAPAGFPFHMNAMLPLDFRFHMNALLLIRRLHT